MSDTVPKLFTAAPTARERKAREAAAGALVLEHGLDLATAVRTIEDAHARIADLSTPDRRWIDQLRVNRQLGCVVRALSMAGAGAYRATDLALENGAHEVAAATGAKPGSALHSAITRTLLDP